MLWPNMQELSELSDKDIVSAVKLMRESRSPTYVEEELLKRPEQLIHNKEQS